MIGGTLRFAVAFLVALAAPLAVALGMGSDAAARTWEQERAHLLEEAVQEARAALAAQDTADADALAALCRHDLLIDTWMQAMSAPDAELERTLTRQLAPRARSLGLGVLAVLDARSPAAPLRGAHPARGVDGARLLRDANLAEGRPFVHVPTARASTGLPRLGFRLQACVGRRDGAHLVVVGGRALAPSDGLVEGLRGWGAVRFFVTGRDGAPPREAPRAAAQRRVAPLLAADGATVAQWVAVLPEATPPTAPLSPDRVALVALAAALVSLLFGWLVSRRLAAPLAALETAARRVAGGDLATSIHDTHGGPARRTATAFNEMTEELGRARARLRRAERIAAWRDIARQIAHEIKNPLSPIQVSIETMRKTYAKQHPDFAEIFEESTLTILEEVERLKRIVTEFSQFARMPRPRPEPLRVEELAEHVASLHRGGPVALEVEVLGAPSPVNADRAQITQVLVNLVKNAVEAAQARHGEAGGGVRLRVEPAPTGVRVEVRDNGPGIPPELRLRIFEPYFTTKSEGTGLGLAIAYRIVEDHGGSLEADENEGGGTVLRLLLPFEGPPLEPETLTESPLGPGTRR